MIRCQWEITATSKPASVADVLEILLRNRSVGASFLNGSLKDLEAHLNIMGMKEGAVLMAQYLAAGKKVVLIGDYDCDGITSVAQMAHFLRDIGYDNYAMVIPQRAEGYGVPERAVLLHPDASLFVAMDCGTHDGPAVTAARSLGADFLVIDHHEVTGAELAPATVLVNPKQPSCPSVFKDFCASGLTLLFLAQLRKALNGKFPAPRLGEKYQALAALGTVADLAPLVDANRILTQNGLNCMNKKTYPPLRELARSAGLSGKVLTAGHLGYYLGPRINAAGRMADASVALDFFMAERGLEVSRLAEELNRLNVRRQQQEDQILNEVRIRYEKERARRRTLIMADPRWPHGVVGIIASRIQQEFHYGPTIVFSIDEGAGVARGSARGIAGFDIFGALKSCSDLLVKWGGHRMAAGMTLAVENLEGFAERFEEVALTYPAEVFVPRRKVDMELDLGLVSIELLNGLKKLEPHGLGNPLPTFAARNVTVALRRAFGREKNHLHLVLDNRVEGIFWRGEQCMPKDWRNNDPLDLIYQIEWDDFRSQLILSMKDAGKVSTLWS